VYQVLAQLDVPGDAQLVKILHWVTLAATLVIGSLEALVATDLQRAAGLMAEVYMLLSHMASDIEAVRIGSNLHLTSLADRRSTALTTVNPHLQATVLESQKQAMVNNALLNRATVSLGASSRFFPSGGSDSATALSATPLPYSAIASVTPYDPTLFSALALSQGQLPAQPTPQPAAISTSAPASSAAPSTTHTNDQPNGGNKNNTNQGGRGSWSRGNYNNNSRNNGDRRGGNKWFNSYRNSRDKRETNNYRDNRNNRDNRDNNYNNNERRDYNWNNSNHYNSNRDNRYNNYNGGRGSNY
jgi:hypothetical protein